MKILVTGANGFIGKNLVVELRNKGYTEIFEYTRESDSSLLETYTKECDFIFHLAGVNRPNDVLEFVDGNINFTARIIDLLKIHDNKAPIVMASSIQAELDNPYGRSKRSAEDLLYSHALELGSKIYLYRLPNVFGKWSKPFYNSVVATFCYSIARGLEIQVDNPDAKLRLCYIDDVVKEFIRALWGNPTKYDDYYVVPVEHSITVGQLATQIYKFKEIRHDLMIPYMANPLTKKLYSTYLSFLPEDQFSYELKINRDYRGTFTEFLRTPERGQVSINRSKPGITKGNHWHHSKNEKFLVVSGEGLIRLRNISSEEIIEYRVSGEKLEVVDIPVGYTHSIKNVGEVDLVTVMWANECFDSENPDTYYLEV